MKFFINAGHGRTDPGAVSKNNYYEKDIARSVAGFLVQMLIMQGHNVEFFQQEKSVNEVVEAEKKSNSNLFISIHCNASENVKAGGVEVLYYPNSGIGQSLAKKLSLNLAEYMELKNRGAKERNDLRVLSGTKAPAVLVELAFLSNPKEEVLLINEPYSFASGILKGINQWIQ